MIKAKKLIGRIEDIGKTLIYEGLSISANMPPSLNSLALSLHSAINRVTQSGFSQT